MSGKRAVVKQSLPELIANDLRERILSGELKEGEAIRQELLADEYGVSRMPVREALKRLSAEGLVMWENHRGGSVIKHSLREIGEIFDLRMLIEVDLFRHSIPAMTEGDFLRCEKLLDEMAVSYQDDDVSRWGKLNFDYHCALYAAAKRPLSEEILARLSVHSDRYVRIHLSVMKQREPAKEEHRKLLELAKSGSVDQACALLERHIERTKSSLLELIAAQRAAEEG
ncbi:GntR family transcriptional regulator [Aliiroseovarius crassostreae]|uniref:GntR family transcriptional regulator n=1 Tax=Aliiroseovarius crassostreae TaxID=154981 RepID=UPI00220EEE58|nr:GntR family transcriptional regulator [Aliiroseovarius crassostreae]UWP89195.1 GntR family transcriptional regulator [Aliiroseovarius crassostreae]